MRHTGTPELETDRLLLRRLLPQDAPQMYENWANDPAVTRFLRWEPHKSPAETRELLSAWAELYPNPDYYQWAIVEKATGQVFGSISVYNALLGEPQQKAKWPGLELSGGIWEPGYCIGQKWLLSVSDFKRGEKMINREIIYERNLTGSFMKIAAGIHAGLDEKLMLRRKLPGLLAVEKAYMDGEGQYWYNISGKQSLDMYCRES